MTDSVIVCNGCCCGNTKKEGHNTVPTDFLETEWERQGLAENIKLKISDCLGPCSMHNVALLKTNEGHTWIGNLSEIEHFEALESKSCSCVNKGALSLELCACLETYMFLRLLFSYP